MSSTATAAPPQTITVDTAESICTIRLNRPETFNAFNDALSKEFAEALKNAERDANVRAIIITGEGKAFCSGQDLRDLKSHYVPGYVPHFADDLKRRYDPIIKKIATIPKPVIAAVNGVAAGAGCSLALACDMRIVSEQASFIEVFINVGLVPDSGSTWYLPRLVGLGKAMELCMTGQKVDAAEALRLGIANKVVPADQLMNEAKALASRLASLPGVALALTKKLLMESFERDLNSQLEAEAYAQDTAGRTADHFEGVTAFIEKRKPAFKGR